MIGLIYLAWASHLLQSMAPDEAMRSDVPFWIVNHGKLPIGNEKDIINPTWGFCELPQ